MMEFMGCGTTAVRIIISIRSEICNRDLADEEKSKEGETTGL